MVVTQTRREAMHLGVCAIAAALTASCRTSAPTETTGATQDPRRISTVGGSFVSAARGGIETNWIIARPAQQTEPVHPVIALHWRTGNAAQAMALGLKEQLGNVIAGGAGPFAVVCVDGGDTYWHRRISGQDSGSMVINELLPLIETHGIDVTKVAFMGWSMGGYGALLLGGRLGAPRTAAISVTSPAVWPEDDFPPVAFDGVQDWTANSVWGLPGLSSIPIRIDCGTEDQLLPIVKKYSATLPVQPAGMFTTGAHNDKYFAGQVRAELDWLAPYIGS